MSKHNILASISMLFDNLSPPWSRLPATEWLIQMENRQHAHERLTREVEAVFSQRDELLAALKAAMHFIDVHVADPDITNEMCQAWEALQRLNPRAAIAKAEGGQSEQ